MDSTVCVISRSTSFTRSPPSRSISSLCQGRSGIRYLEKMSLAAALFGRSILIFTSKRPGRSTAGSMRSDRKSTRLNSSHGYISYAVFCLKKKKHTTDVVHTRHDGITYVAQMRLVDY